MMHLPEGAAAAGFQLLHVTRAESTNAAALRAVEHGADRLWIVADEQTAGRGRHGRAWQSPPGNLYASLALAAPCPPPFAPLIGFATGLSLAEAVVGLAPGLADAVRLKWPNDCLLAGGKLAGILIEGTSLPGRQIALAVGIGVNIAHVPDGLGRTAAALADHTGEVDPPALFSALATRMAANLALFARGQGFESVRARWLEHALALGTPLTVRPPSGERHGAFGGIDAAGHLLLHTPGGPETILVGDVFLSDHAIPSEDARRITG